MASDTETFSNVPNEPEVIQPRPFMLTHETERTSLSGTTMGAVGSEELNNCDICKNIWALVSCDAPSESRREMNHITYKDIAANGCTRHLPLFGWAKEHNQKDEAIDVTVESPRQGALRLAWYDIPHDGSIAKLQKIHLEKKPSSRGHPGFVRTLDPDWMDTSLVNVWLKNCLGSHHDSCSQPIGMKPIRPAWLVDIWRKCIVPGSDCQEDFVALSYVWGDVVSLNFDQNTIRTLQNPGAFDDEVLVSQVPASVRHAMALTGQIGQRYIWIDALCINHHNVEQQVDQLQKMGAIYASAVFVLVLMDQTAENDILGIPGVTTSRDLRETKVPFGKEHFLEHHHDNFFDLTRGGMYHRRAWTYQEFMLARRRVIVDGRCLYWFCQHGMQAEYMHHDAGPIHLLPQTDYMSQLARRLPDLSLLNQIIGNYNQRQLKHEDDALPAIIGLLNSASLCFVGGFQCGLPEMFFEAALTWQPQYGSTKGVTRRKRSNDPRKGHLKPCHLPSWSWIGWKGDIEMGSLEAGTINRDRVPVYETIPITTWYSCDPANSCEKREIKSAGFQYRDMFRESQPSPPEGWTRHSSVEMEDYEILFPRRCGDFVFRHDSMAEFDLPWYWPYPVLGPQDNQVPDTPEQLPCISCDTRRAYVLARSEGYLVSSPADKYGMMLKYTGQYRFGPNFRWTQTRVTLHNDEKDQIGYLRLHRPEQLPHFGSLEAVWFKVELVAICRRIKYMRRPCGSQRFADVPTEIEEVYNVLWIEWKDGIAYRLACGEITREGWDNMETESISLVLG